MWCWHDIKHDIKLWAWDILSGFIIILLTLIVFFGSIYISMFSFILGMVSFVLGVLFTMYIGTKI